MWVLASLFSMDTTGILIFTATRYLSDIFLSTGRFRTYENDVFATLYRDLYIGALTCMRDSRKVRGLEEESNDVRGTSSLSACAIAKDRRSPRACVRERGAKKKRILKSPFSCVSSSMTSRKVRSVATPMRRQRVDVYPPGVYRSLPVLSRWGSARFSTSVVEDYKARTIGCAADSPRASRNDDVVCVKRPKSI